MPLNIELPYAFRELQKPTRHKAFYGGRGGAKSHSLAAELVLKGYQRKQLRWLCCREIQNSVKSSVKKLLEDKIRLAGLGPKKEGGNGFYIMTERGIRSYDGNVEFLFSGLRSNPESVKSMEGLDGAWVEEANNVSQRSIDLLIPTVRKPNSELWWSWNPRHDNDPVHKMFLGGKPPPNSVVRKVLWSDNPWFPDVLRDEMDWAKSRDIDKWLHVWEGNTIKNSEARVFKNWTVEDLDGMLDADAIPRLGADWGYSIDPTVIIQCYLINNGGKKILYINKEAYKVKCTIEETPALFAGNDRQSPKRWRNPFGHRGLEAAHSYKIIADSARPETIKYLRDKGFNVVAAMKGARSIEEGIEFIQSYDTVIHPDCTHTIDEFTHYSFKEDPLTNEILPELVDKNNHVIDAARYALEAVRRGAERYDTNFIGPQIVTH